MNARLKEIIFKKLYRDLSKVEIISYKDEIWFIDREKKYWYFIYFIENHELLWRFPFFERFFFMFSMYNRKYEPLISEWVEEVLNCKVNAIFGAGQPVPRKVEEVLNCKVDSIDYGWRGQVSVEEVLNYKIT